MGALGAAGMAAGTVPWTEAMSDIAGPAHVSPGSQSGQAVFHAGTGPPPRGGGPALAAAAASGRPRPTGLPERCRRHRRQAPGRHRRQAPGAGSSRPSRTAARPYLIYDSVIPGAIPARQRVATYVNGSYAVSARAVAGRGSVLWIDTNGSDPAASALDVELGDATPAAAPQWVQRKLRAQPRTLAIIYTMRSDWQQVKAGIAALPAWMRSRVRYWIADPTGVPHMVAGSSATQWYWGNSYDIHRQPRLPGSVTRRFPERADRVTGQL